MIKSTHELLFKFDKNLSSQEVPAKCMTSVTVFIQGYMQILMDAQNMQNYVRWYVLGHIMGCLPGLPVSDHSLLCAPNVVSAILVFTYHCC